jgi:hypothetical protein
MMQMFDGDRYGGVICSFDGQYYKVRYPQDGDEEELSDSDFEGGDIEVLAGSTDSSDDNDSGSDTDDTGSDTEDSIDDENGIAGQVISAPPSSPRKKSSGSAKSQASKVSEGSSKNKRTTKSAKLNAKLHQRFKKSKSSKS